MMHFDKLTQKAGEAVAQSQTLAVDSGHQQLSPIHLLVVLIKQQDGVVPKMLAKLGVQTSALVARAHESLHALPRITGSDAQGELYVSPSLAEVFQRRKRLKNSTINLFRLSTLCLA